MKEGGGGISFSKQRSPHSVLQLRLRERGYVPLSSIDRLGKEKAGLLVLLRTLAARSLEGGSESKFIPSDQVDSYFLPVVASTQVELVIQC